MVCPKCGTGTFFDRFTCPRCGQAIFEESVAGPPGLTLGNFLFSFRGRITRSEYWGTHLFTLVPLVLLVLLFGVVGSAIGAGARTIAALAALALYAVSLVFWIWVGLAAQVKRWHDRHKSGWMVLINLVPVVGWVWTLVELGFLRGTPAPNRFGDDPGHAAPRADHVPA